MERSLGMERTFSLGNYKNIKVSDYISGIPEDLMLNPEFVSTVREIQFVNTDQVYFEYIRRSPTAVDGITPEEAIEALDEAAVQNVEKLTKIFASIGIENQTTVEETNAD